jgi:hypothetical protein
MDPATGAGAGAGAGEEPFNAINMHVSGHCIPQELLLSLSHASCVGDEEPSPDVSDELFVEVVVVVVVSTLLIIELYLSEFGPLYIKYVGILAVSTLNEGNPDHFSGGNLRTGFGLVIVGNMGITISKK